MSITPVTPDAESVVPTGGAAPADPGPGLPPTGRGALGLVTALASAATFGTAGTFADSLMHTGWSPAAVVTWRIGIAALVLTGPAAVALRGRWSLLWRARGAVVGFGVLAVAGCQVCFFAAVQRLDVGIALLLEYLGIVLVVGWMWVRHGRRPGRLTGVGALAALVGLVLVLDPTAGGGLDPLGVLLGLAAGTGLAGYFVISAHDRSGLPPIALAWGGMVVGVVGLGLVDLVHLLPWRTERAQVALGGAHTSWLVPIVGLGVVAAAFAYVAGIAANRLLGATVASFVGLSEVLFAVLFAWLWLGQVPGPAQLAGGAVVLVGIVLVRLDGARTPLPALEAVPADQSSRMPAS